MGHAHHFLSRLDRISLQQVELALGLYNDAALVRSILERSGLPPGDGRVAISLDDRNEGPFLIVARDGGFVTCLGRGMSHKGLPLVRRWQLDMLAERHQGLRACMRPVDRVPEAERASSRTFRRLFNAGPDLTREEFLDLAPLQPMMFWSYQRMVKEVYGRLGYLRHRLRRVEGPRPRPCEMDLLESYWKHLWALRHLYVLLGAGEPVEYFEALDRAELERITESTGSFGGYESAFAVGVAAAWSTARHGGAFVPICRHRFERSENGARVEFAGLELAAVAGAHEALRGDVLASLRAFGRPAANDAPASPLHDERVDIATAAIGSLERAADLDVRAARHGAEGLFARPHPAAARHGWRGPADVPVDVARPLATLRMGAWVRTDGVFDLLHELTPSVARYRPEEFFLPERWARELRTPWSPEDALAHLDVIRDYYLPKKPARAEKAPDRNDPCPCASGAKYKKCCALAPKPPAPPPERAATLADGIPAREPARAAAPAAPAADERAA